jgi:hypothetical protein
MVKKEKKDQYTIDEAVKASTFGPHGNFFRIGACNFQNASLRK